jgi:L-ribulokinase
MSEKFVIGVDFGTDSVRSILLNAGNGEEIVSSIFYYPRWKDGLYCDSHRNQFRQHPLDYIEGLESTIKFCLKKAGNKVAQKVVAISADTTGSTPVAVDRNGIPLSLLPQFESNPNAMFVLWKDHTSVKEAAEINMHAKKFPVNYLKYVGGIYSTEWFWSKLLHVLREDSEVRNTTYSFVEHCDWIPFLLIGGSDVGQMKRSVCAAGHKALWSEEFGGLPPNKFFASLDPLLDGFTSRLYSKAYTSDLPAGNLSKAWAERLGLPETVIVGVGAFDAHMGAVGGQIQPYYLSRVMGTSTCDMLVAPIKEVETILVKGICGQVPGSVIPGMMGMEAGQSAFGDTYAWFRNVVIFSMKSLLLESSVIDQETGKLLEKELSEKLITQLSKEADLLPLNENDELALDWLNGRRTPDANQELKAVVMNLNLSSDAPRFFKALVESTCFGAKAIIDRFIDEGIIVKGLIGTGGVARKAPYVMQTLADVTGMSIQIHKSEQTCASGAAMFAATAAGLHTKVEDAMNAMGRGFDKEYFPNSARRNTYDKRYLRYKALGNFIEKMI